MLEERCREESTEGSERRLIANYQGRLDLLNKPILQHAGTETISFRPYFPLCQMSTSLVHNFGVRRYDLDNTNEETAFCGVVTNTCFPRTAEHLDSHEGGVLR